MTNTQTYNGWVNYETWLTNLWFDNFDFTEDLDIFDGCDDKDDILQVIEDYIENYVTEMVEYSFSPGDSHGFIHDMLNSALQEIDYRDIAEHYVDDVEEALEERKEDESDELEDSTNHQAMVNCMADNA